MMKRMGVLKALGSVFVLGIGFWMISVSPAHGQVGGMGDAVKKSVGDAVMKGAAEKAGVPAPGAPAAAPSEEGAAADAPAGEPPAEQPAAADEPADEAVVADEPAADAAGEPADEPEAAPGVAVPALPTGVPGATK